MPNPEKPTLLRDYFDALYQQNADPWHFETKPYEREKYAATLRNLPRENYQNALELGCSIGVLSQQLGRRCGHLLSLDVAEVPLQIARERCTAQANIEFVRATLPGEFPDGRFDLILLSEVGYYFAMPDLKRLQERILAVLEPDGDLVCVHYLPFVPDYPLTGDAVHEAFFALGLEHVQGFRAERYRFDAWRNSSISRD